MRVATRALALCLLLTPLPLTAQAPQPAAAQSSEAALAGFDAFVAETLRKWNVPGVAVSVVKDGKIILLNGYGVRDPATGQPMTKDTVFPIASMSKAFTSFGAALLVDEGQMSFDAPVVTYLPGLAFKDPAASSGLTLRDMLSHRSGLPRHDALWYHNEALTPDGLVTRMPHLEPSAPLRAKFQYNNNMFVLSGLAIEKVSGKSFESFIEDRVFVPLGMANSTFSPERARANPNHVGGRVVSNGEPVNVPMFRNTKILNPAGGVYSSADDLGAWMLVHLSSGRLGSKQIVQPATLADMHATHMPLGVTIRDPQLVPVGYGLGWFTGMYRGRQLVQHGGNLNGISTLVALLPAERLGVTVLVNHGASELRDALARQILDRFLGATDKDWVGEALARKTAGEASEVTARQMKGGTRVPGTQPSHPTAAYAGSYVDPGYGTLTVKAQGNQLIGRFNEDSSPLSHWHYDVFDGATADVENLWRDSRLQFVSDMAGRVSGVTIVMDSTVAPIVFKKQPDAKLSDPAYLRNLTGTYELAGNQINISLAGKKLIYLVKGGSPGELIPSLGGEFVNSRRLDARIAFKTDASGRATALTSTDASGVYEAKRID